MRVLIDIGHPAHMHFFKNAIRVLQKRGDEVLVTSRVKEFTTELLDELGISHTPLSELKKGGLFSLGKELVKRDLALLKVVKRFKPDIMAGIGGVFIAQVGRLTRVPSLVFYDTENAKLQNAITYPFASCVLVPQCYETWVPKRRHVRYSGYHELAYLHPHYFTPDQNIAIENGIQPEQDNFFLRLVSWQANHDIGETGWSEELTLNLVKRLEHHGKVMISSEQPLPASLQSYAYQGSVKQVHHVMAFCRMVLGESATMASEAAVLGVPALYIANTGRGYTNEQERKYQLVHNVRELKQELILEAVDKMLARPKEFYQQQHKQLLSDTIDVTGFIVNCLDHYPDFLHDYRKQIAG